MDLHHQHLHPPGSGPGAGSPARHHRPHTPLSGGSNETTLQVGSPTPPTPPDQQPDHPHHTRRGQPNHRPDHLGERCWGAVRGWSTRHVHRDGSQHRHHRQQRRRPGRSLRLRRRLQRQLRSASGSGWTCTTSTCTHPGPVPALGALPAITASPHHSARIKRDHSPGPAHQPSDSTPTNNQTTHTTPSWPTEPPT